MIIEFNDKIASYLQGEIKSALEELHRLHPGMLSQADQVIRHMVQRVAGGVAGLTLLSLQTAADVALIYGVTAQRIRMIARARKIGWQVPGTRTWLFRPQDIPALQPGKPGRPRPAG